MEIFLNTEGCEGGNIYWGKFSITVLRGETTSRSLLSGFVVYGVWGQGSYYAMQSNRT
jgi:hypothetical protein